MKIQIISKPEDVKHIGFPIIMEAVFKDPSRRLIVLFTEERSGIVLYQQNDMHEVGKYITGWCDPEEGNHWKKYRGEIIISND